MKQQAKKRTRLRRETMPTQELMEEIDAIEEDPTAGGRNLQELAAYLASLLPGPVYGFHSGILPPEPTDAQPGSEEKILVYRQRAYRGYALNHPDDRTNRQTPGDR